MSGKTISFSLCVCLTGKRNKYMATGEKIAHSNIRDKLRLSNRTKPLLDKDTKLKIDFREYLIIFRFLIISVLSTKIKIKIKQSLTYYKMINSLQFNIPNTGFSVFVPLYFYYVLSAHRIYLTKFKIGRKNSLLISV